MDRDLEPVVQSDLGPPSPGARWDDAVPPNTWHGYPVVDTIDGLRAAITALR